MQFGGDLLQPEISGGILGGISTFSPNFGGILAGLTDTRIRNAKPTDKTQRIYDSGGLYLEIPPTGGKLWRVKYRFGGKEKRLAPGSYPA